MNSDIIVPFDIELARRIKNGSVIGKFCLENGNEVDFVYELKEPNSKAPFLFVAELYRGSEFRPITTWVNKEGLGIFHSSLPSLVMIETNVSNVFHDGDILIDINDKPFIFNGNASDGRVGSYCGITNNGYLNINGAGRHWTKIREEKKYIRKATDEERRKFAEQLLDKGKEKGEDFVKSFMSEYLDLETKCHESGEIVKVSYISTLQEMSYLAVERIVSLLDCYRQEAYLIIQDWAFEYMRSWNGGEEGGDYHVQMYNFINRKINDMKQKMEKSHE